MAPIEITPPFKRTHRIVLFLQENGQVEVGFDGNDPKETCFLLEKLLFGAEYVARCMATMDPSLKIQHLTIKALSNNVFRYGRKKGYR